MQIPAAAKYVGYPQVVTVQIIDALRLGFQRGFWPAKDLTTEYAENSQRTLRTSLDFNTLFSEQDDQPAWR
jgi:hypothetical protein